MPTGYNLWICQGALPPYGTFKSWYANLLLDAADALCNLSSKWAQPGGIDVKLCIRRFIHNTSPGGLLQAGYIMSHTATKKPIRTSRFRQMATSVKSNSNLGHFQKKWDAIVLLRRRNSYDNLGSNCERGEEDRIREWGQPRMRRFLCSVTKSLSYYLESAAWWLRVYSCEIYSLRERVGEGTGLTFTRITFQARYICEPVWPPFLKNYRDAIRARIDNWRWQIQGS